MFDTKRFGAYISTLRKKKDMTQNELADRLNVTRQAVSKYELGDSFPDISILVLMANIFEISLDELVGAGNPTKGEAVILKNIAKGDMDIQPKSISDIVNIAPHIKPSVLSNLAGRLEKDGIDITHVVRLAEYLYDENVQEFLENASFDAINPDIMKRLIPFLDEHSKQVVFAKILNGELDWHLIKELIPYAAGYVSQIEAAVVEGVLPYDALGVMREGIKVLYHKRNIS